MLPLFIGLCQIHLPLQFACRSILDELRQCQPVRTEPTKGRDPHSLHGISTELLRVDTQAPEKSIGIRRQVNGRASLSRKLRSLKNLDENCQLTINLAISCVSTHLHIMTLIT
jgi:hypothetical protein